MSSLFFPELLGAVAVLCSALFLDFTLQAAVFIDERKHIKACLLNTQEGLMQIFQALHLFHKTVDTYVD